MDNPPTKTSKKILVIEDDFYLLDLYVDILTGEGYQVDKAADGEVGLAALQKGGFDLVLLDIMLPKIDGLAILEKLSHEPPQNPNKAIVVLSNLGHDSAIAQAVSLGARGYMIKSEYTPDQVISKVKEYLGSAQ